MKKTIAWILAVLLLIPCAAAVNAYDKPYQRVLYAQRTYSAPNPEEIDASWGESLIHVSADLPDAEIYNYWDPEDPNPNIGPGTLARYLEGKDFIYAEPSDFDFYVRWDEENLYIAVKSPDEEPAGNAAAWCGDGIQLWIKNRDEIDDPTYHYSQGMYPMYWTLSVDDYTVQKGDLAEQEDLDTFLEVWDGWLTATVRIPFSAIGISAGDVKNGLSLGLALMRISSRSERDWGYAGWLEWGFDHVVTIVLDDSKVEPTQETVAAEVLEGVSEWALKEVEAGILEGLVPAELQQNYTTPVTRGQVAQMFINLLEKATGKTVDEIMAEKGVAINGNAFTDTTDKAVLAANALGIINGTGNGKFSPDGTLKRAQIAAIINRVAKVMGVETEGYTHEFTDITDNYKWADSELGWPVYAGIINGVGGGKFNPDGDLTTEQAILITYRGLSALRPVQAE